jgi:hypothetical protein
VKYYLDQASLAESVGAKSAAAAMYRAALDQILYEQGFKDGTCGVKLKHLTAAVEAGTAPAWANTIERDFLTLLKEIGDGSIHPNDGDVSRQQVIDTRVLAAIHQTMSHLLYHVYEQPHIVSQRREALAAASKMLKPS